MQKELEKEICKEFGDDALDLLHRDMAGYRRKVTAFWVCYYLIAALIFGLINIYCYKQYARYVMLFGCPTVEAFVVKAETTSTREGKTNSKSSYVKYRFKIDDEVYFGNSKIYKSYVRKLNKTNKVTVFYLPSDPSINRAAMQINPIYFWGLLFGAFVILFILITRSIYGSGPPVKGVLLKADLFWLSHLKKYPKISPRAWYRYWMRYRYYADKRKAFCSGAYPAEKMISREFLYIEKWMEKHDNRFSLSEYLVAKLPLCDYFYQDRKEEIKLTDISPLEKLDFIKEEKKLGFLNRRWYRLITDCARDRSPHSVLVCNLKGLDEQKIIMKMIEKEQVRRGLNQGKATIGNVDDDPSFFYQRLTGLTGTVKSEGNLMEEEMFDLKHSLLYLFYEFPWSRSPVKKKIKVKIASKEYAQVSFEFKPDEYIRISGCGR